MKKNSCFKKLGAVIMAVAMTAMMIPGVVFAGDPIPPEPEKVAIEKIEITDFVAPKAGETAKLPGNNGYVEPSGYTYFGDGKTGDSITGSTYILGWTDQDNKAFTGTFEDGKKYTYTIAFHGCLADNKQNVVNESTKVYFKDVEVKSFASVEDTQENTTWGLFKYTWDLGASSETQKIVDEGGNETISASSDKDLVLKCEKNLPDEGFKFYFGGKELTSNECKVEKGSTIVTVYATYLDTLPGGDYEVTFSYPDGNITNTVTLTKAAAEEKAPQTGEFSSMTTTILFISLLGLAGLGFYAKKKEFF